MYRSEDIQERLRVRPFQPPFRIICSEGLRTRFIIPIWSLLGDETSRSAFPLRTTRPCMTKSRGCH